MSDTGETREARTVEVKKNGEGKMQKKLGNWFHLAEGARWRNLVAMLLHSFCTVMLLAFMNSMQAFLLREVYEVNEDEYGTVTGTLSLVDEIWSFLWLGIWGIMSDKIGRRYVCVLGYFMVAVSLFLMPHGNKVYPGLLLIRLIFAQGAAALTSMMTALMSDFIAIESLGVGSGLVGIASGLGAVTSVFILVGFLPIEVCVTNTYYIAGVIPALMVAVSWFMLKSPGASGGNPEAKSSTKESTYLTLVGKAMKDIKENSRLGVAVFSGFHARASTVVISVFLSLWISKYYDANDLCGSSDGTHESKESACGELLESQNRSSCGPAYTQTAKIGGMTQTIALIFALLFGWLSNRKRDPLLGLGIISTFAIFSFASVGIISDPTSSLMYLVAFIWGISEMGIVVFAQVAITMEMRLYKDMKGTISGLYSMTGSIGVVVISLLGGFLFDEWIPTAPFILMAVANALLAIACFSTLIFSETRFVGPQMTECLEKPDSAAADSSHQEVDGISMQGLQQEGGHNKSKDLAIS